MNHSGDAESRPRPTDDDLEQRIWAYAAGLLEADEARAVAWEVADNATAKELLRTARHAFEEAARRTPLTLADARAAARARAHFKVSDAVGLMSRWVSGTAETVIHAVGVIIRTGNALVAELVEGTQTFELAAARVLTTPSSLAPIPAETKSEGSLAFRCADGTEFIVSAVAHQEFQIHIRAAPVRAGAIVSATRFDPGDTRVSASPPLSLGKDTHLDTAGHATLNDCPEGLLVIGIGDVKYVLALRSEPG